MNAHGRFLGLLLVSILYDPVIGFPGGAGGCGGGMAAVAGSHLNSANDRPVVPGQLLDGLIRVSIEGTELTPSSPVDVPTNKDLMITVEAGDIAYLGLLIRLEAPDGVDTDGALVQGANTQGTATCTAPIIGITHTNNDEKTMSTGTIRFDEEVEGVQLDVTVVFLNNDAGSAYVYSRLPVNFRNTAADTTSAPSTTPPDQTAAPTSSNVDTTSAPVAVMPPNNVPVVAPIPASQPTPNTNPAVTRPSIPSLLAPTPTTQSVGSPSQSTDGVAFDDVPSAPQIAASNPQTTSGGFFNRRPTLSAVDTPTNSGGQFPKGKMKMMKGMMKNSGRKGMMMGKKGKKGKKRMRRNRPKRHGIFQHQTFDTPQTTSGYTPAYQQRSMMSGIFSRP